MSATTIIVNDETPRRQYTASAGQTVFDFPFPFFADGDLEVYLTPNGQQPSDTADIQIIVTDYTVSGANTQSGGQITLTSGATAGDIVTILRIVDIDRTADYQAAGDLLAETLNAEQDTEIMISQQLREEADRSIRSQKSDVTVDMTLPSAADRADGVLTFDAVGSPTATSTSAFVAGLSGAILGANYVTNNATGDGTTLVYTVSVAPGSKTNIQIYIDGVYQNKASFSVSGTTVTFTQAPPLNSSIEFMIGYAIATASGAGSITFTQAGTGAVTRTVESRLQDVVSVKDFGAVGDGTTDDTAAIQAALDTAASIVTVPTGTYKITSALTMAENQTLKGNATLKLYGTFASETNLVSMNNGCCLYDLTLEAGDRDTATGITDSKYGGDTSYNYLDNTNGVGRIASTDVSDIIVDSVTIKYFKRGFYFSSHSSTIEAERIRLLNLKVIQCGEYLGTLYKVKDFEISGGNYWHGGGNGITLPSVQNGIVSNIRMRNPSGTGINPGGSTASGLGLSWVTITGNHIVARDCINIENGGQHISITSNNCFPWSIAGADGNGISVRCDQNGNGQDTEDVHVASNTIYGGLSLDEASGSKASQGIILRTIDTSNPVFRDIHVIGNKISGIDDDAISVAGTSGNTVEDVHIHSNAGRSLGRRGVTLTYADNFTVLDNDFNRNGSGVAASDKLAYRFSDVSNGTITGNRSKDYYDHLHFIGAITGTVHVVVRLSYDNSYSGGEFVLYSGQTGYSAIDVANVTSGGPLIESFGGYPNGATLATSNILKGCKVYKRDSGLSAGGTIGEVYLGSGTWKAFGDIAV